jgi:tRNA (cmo5U34)-methyltransferase
VVVVHTLAMADEPWQFHFDPDSYLAMVTEEIPTYHELQRRTAEATAVATADRRVRTILELGVGTGETASRVMEQHSGATLVGIDESAGMLAHARGRLPDAEFLVQRLEDPLPPGSFDLIVSVLAVHHLDGPGKADLFARVAGSLTPAGRFVMADLVVPDDPDDAVTPIDGVYDRPSPSAEQLHWMVQAGLQARIEWADQDLALFVAERPA